MWIIPTAKKQFLLIFVATLDCKFGCHVAWLIGVDMRQNLCQSGTPHQQREMTQAYNVPIECKSAPRR